jgi:predicted transcriptional regulator of viral defense system
MWVTHHELAMVSQLGKTIVNVLSKPHLYGRTNEIEKSIYHSKERTDLCITIHPRTGAAKKSYLFLTDFLEMEWTSDHERMLEESGSNFSPIDPAVPDRGIKNSRFGLKINIEANTLTDSTKSVQSCTVELITHSS